MIPRLAKVTPELYRGGAPTERDVEFLSKIGIKKIVSLDETSGNAIDSICNKLHIKHIIIPITYNMSTLLNFLKFNLKDLLLTGGPTFIHCQHGKDRTGLAIALLKIKYLGVSPKSALDEALAFGFGTGLDPSIKKLFEKLILTCDKAKQTSQDLNLINDMGSEDIVSNSQPYISDNHDSYLDEAHQTSFAPYLPVTNDSPQDIGYSPLQDQSIARQNYRDQLYSSLNGKDTVTPLVGLYNNEANGNVGPTLNMSGFIYD